jgi:hypothetical protein
MTPKEKAEELVFKLLDKAKHPYKEVTFEQSRLCALICVEEIISIPSIQAAYAQGYSDSKSTESYWREVKQELLKL